MQSIPSKYKNALYSTAFTKERADSYFNKNLNWWTDEIMLDFKCTHNFHQHLYDLMGNRLTLRRFYSRDKRPHHWKSGTAIALGRARQRAPRSFIVYTRNCGFAWIIEAENAVFGRLTYILTLKMVHLPNNIWPRRRPCHILSNGISYIQIDAAV